MTWYFRMESRDELNLFLLKAKLVFDDGTSAELRWTVEKHGNKYVYWSIYSSNTKRNFEVNYNASYLGDASLTWRQY